MKSLIVLFSYHHHNTEKSANVIAKVLDAQITTPQKINPSELGEYDLTGFGSGIYSSKHHESLLDFADKLPPVTNKNAFIFSTNGSPVTFTNSSNVEPFLNNHVALKEKLQSKGYTIVGEFSCAGFNTNSFLKVFGGINKGRPNAEDLKCAEEFALNLKQKLQ